ncbi:MAG TPA: M3 family metallopeptidase [Thermoplasmata archaeon]|nr:M3 family metallopeptidase [Thermoplasmata archaeon]
MAPPDVPGPSDVVTLGEMPFSLDAGELRRRGLAILRRADEEIEGLAHDESTPTVRSLLVPLNALLVRVIDVSHHGQLLFQVHPDGETRTAAREILEAADRFFHAFQLSAPLYARLRAIDLSRADDLVRFAVEKTLRRMRRAGVEKDATTRQRLQELNEEIDRVENQFGENIARLVRSIEITSAEDLAGVPADYLASHPPDERGRIRITTRYPDFFPVMAYADREDVRRRLLFEFMNRAYPENEPVLDRLLQLRYDFSRGLGYSSYAAFAIEDKMMGTPEAARAFLERSAGLLSGPAREVLARYLQRRRRDDPAASRLEPWDGAFFGPGYYDEKVRAEEFGVDLRVVRKYLAYGPVRDGLFALCQELFGLEFRRAREAEVWHPSVEAYDVRQRGVPLGRAYLDMVPRPGKFSHAACFGVREGVAGIQLPQAALICNFVDAAESIERARMEYQQVVTFFHEFGHLVHDLLSGRNRWVYHRASELEWDFIEAPSQLFEEWARDPDTLARFARDPDTGATIPTELVERLVGSLALGRSIFWIRQVALAAVSLELYDHPPDGRSVPAAARAAFGRYALLELPADYHFETAFGHLTGYSAFYYTYAWSLAIARDLLSPFLERKALTDPALAERYAREILAPGSERPAAELVRSYLGRDFTFEAFERWLGAVPRAPGAPAHAETRPGS